MPPARALGADARVHDREMHAPLREAVPHAQRTYCAARTSPGGHLVRDVDEGGAVHLRRQEDTLHLAHVAVGVAESVRSVMRVAWTGSLHDGAAPRAAEPEEDHDDPARDGRNRKREPDAEQPDGPDHQAASGTRSSVNVVLATCGHSVYPARRARFQMISKVWPICAKAITRR